MLIIVEGPDGAGKTTFIEHLQDLLPLKPQTITFHKKQIQTHPLVEYELILDQYRPFGKNVLADRWHWGESIYGPLKRGRSQLYASAWLHIDMFLASKGAAFITLSAPVDEIRRRLRARGETFITPQEVPIIVDAYQTLGRLDTPMELTHYHHNSQAAAIAAVRLATQLERQAARLARFVTYVGPLAPTTLLLGDKRGREQEQHQKAFVPYESTSGHYLLQSILSWGFQGNVGIANACEENVPGMWEELGCPRIVALGRNAAIACATAKVPYGTMPHPQFVRRFHHDRWEQYGAAIKQTAHDQEDRRTWPKS